MKKLNKLQINPEKVMKNEELVTLRGGDYGDDYGVDGGGGSTTCIKCYSASMGNQNSSTFLGSLYAMCPESGTSALEYCSARYPGTVSTRYWCGGNC
jgi:hypothetical protein